MNLPSAKRALPVFALLAIALVLFVLPRIDAMFFANARYAQCSRLIKTDAAKALALAHSWKAEHPDSLLARHCEAVALFAYKDYPHAAEAFIALAKQVTTANPALSVELFLQGAESYRTAGQADQAKQAAVAALLIAPNNDKTKALLSDLDKENKPNTPALAPTPAPPKTP